MTQVTIDVRPVAVEDIDLIERVMPRRLPDVHVDRWQSQQRGEALYLIAWLDKLPVGHLLLTWEEATDTNSDCAQYPILSDISVHSDHQSKGIGSLLMDYAERLAKERGYSQVGLGVALDNPRARALYERRGYRESHQSCYHHRWQYLDESGVVRWHEETCVHLVKYLASEDKQPSSSI